MINEFEEIVNDEMQDETLFVKVVKTKGEDGWMDGSRSVRRWVSIRGSSDPNTIVGRIVDGVETLEECIAIYEVESLPIQLCKLVE